MKRAASIALLILCLSTIIGCAPSQDSKIAGKWVCKKSGDMMKLSADHTCVVYSLGFKLVGKWTMSKSDIKIEAGQIVLTGTFDGKNIVAEDAIMHFKYVFEKLSGKKEN
jgi:hypothetical protein